jgi:hypothetical protein
MSLDDDIRQAIANNLTAEIGTRLKERLDKADADADAVDRMRDTMARMEEDIARHKEHVRSEADIRDREEIIGDRERQLDLKEAVMEAHEKNATASRDDMMKVMEIVFKGPAQRLAFDLQGGLSGLMNASGMSQSPYANLTGKIETDGDSG